MPCITTAKQLREVHHLPFCYVCGKPFANDDPATDDHVPAKCTFAKSDRNLPLILSAHESCNEGLSRIDERSGQMLALMHGKPPPAHNQLIDPVVGTDPSSGLVVGGIGGVDVDLDRFVIRSLRAFHAALYRQFLPDNPLTRFSLSLAIPSGSLSKSGEIMFDEIPAMHRSLVRKIRQNRLADKLDRIECWDGKCVYECVWDRLDDTRPACLFALEIYNLCDFGATGMTPPRGTVGLYWPQEGFPPNATRRSYLDLDHIRLDDLNPFD